MKKINLVCFVIFIFSFSGNCLWAQQKENMQDILMSYKWFYPSNSEYKRPFEVFVSYDKRNQYTEAEFNNQKLRLSFLYYFSDIVDDFFNENKVGVKTNGKYFVCQKQKGEFTIAKILKLDQERFVYKYIDSPKDTLWVNSKKGHSVMFATPK